MCTSSGSGRNFPQPEESFCDAPDVLGDLGQLDAELSGHFVAGPDGSAKRRKVGSVQAPNANVVPGVVGDQPGEASPMDRGSKRKYEARDRTPKREKQSKKVRGSDARSSGFMDPCFDRKRSKKEKRKAGKNNQKKKSKKHRKQIFVFF